jgi:uncharacterized membrane protein
MMRKRPLVMVVFGIFALTVTLAIRFTNASKTETELFLAYWPVWALIALGALFVLFYGERMSDD